MRPEKDLNSQPSGSKPGALSIELDGQYLAGAEIFEISQCGFGDRPATPVLAPIKLETEMRI